MKVRKLTNYKTILEPNLITFGRWNSFPIIGYDQESQLISLRLDEKQSIAFRKEDIESLLKQCREIEENKWKPE